MVKRVMHRTLVAVVLAGAAACSQTGDDGAEATPRRAAVIEAPATPGTADQLVGTTWEVGGYTLAFQEPPRVHISGKEVPIPGGVTGKYAIENGIIEISAANRSHKGTWDGAQLIMEGIEAMRK